MDKGAAICRSVSRQLFSIKNMSCNHYLFRKPLFHSSLLLNISLWTFCDSASLGLKTFGQHTFAQLGFSVSRVTDKKSSWILIYQNTDMSIYTQMVGWLKLNEIRGLIKSKEILIQGRIFNLQTVGENSEPRIFRSFSKIHLVNAFRIQRDMVTKTLFNSIILWY